MNLTLVHGPEVMPLAYPTPGHETNVCTSCTNIGFREHVQTLVSAGSTDAEIWRHWDSDAGLREAFAFGGQLACGQATQLERLQSTHFCRSQC